MEQFMDNTRRLPYEQRRSKFDQIIGFLRQHNAHAEADLFVVLRNAYPKVSYNREEESFQQYLAWCEVAGLQGHKIVNHIIMQG
jgi:hypothetical protein